MGPCSVNLLIQFSVDGWGCVPSLLFDLRPNYGGVNEDNGYLLEKVPWRHVTLSAGSEALRATVHTDMVPLKEVTFIFITSTVVWSQVKQQGGNRLHPSTETWTKDLPSITLPIKTRPGFPHSQSLPSGSFHKPLILLHQRADRLKTTITEN